RAGNGPRHNASSPAIRRGTAGLGAQGLRTSSPMGTRPQRDGSALGGRGFAGRPEVVARLDDALGHGLLGLLEVGARVVDLLVAHVAVDLEDAVVVAEHVR